MHPSPVRRSTAGPAAICQPCSALDADQIVAFPCFESRPTEPSTGSPSAAQCTLPRRRFNASKSRRTVAALREIDRPRVRLSAAEHLRDVVGNALRRVVVTDARQEGCPFRDELSR